MLALLRQRNFSLFWFGQFISIIGDWVLFIALPFYTYSLTGSVLATGAMFMISTLPRLFLGSLAGTFVDRWDRKRTMIVADLLRVVTTLLLLFVHSREGLWLIYISAFLESIFSQFFYPAKSAIIPLLVDEKELLKANSLNGLSDALTRLLGSGLGGVLMGWFGFTSVVLLDAGSFLISALMLFPILMPRRPDVEPLKEQSSSVKGVMGMWRDWIAGLQLVRRERLLLVLFLVLGVALLGDSMISVLIVPLVKDLMGGGSQQLGWLMMAQGVGGLIGGLLVGKIGNRISPRTARRSGTGCDRNRHNGNNQLPPILIGVAVHDDSRDRRISLVYQQRDFIAIGCQRSISRTDLWYARYHLGIGKPGWDGIGWIVCRPDRPGTNPEYFR